MTSQDNLIEYAYPDLYDAENDFETDGPFWLELARQCGGPVLELGCGTGRLTIPMAEQGIDVTGLDASPGMLARAREKAGGLPVQWIEADARAFQLDQRFALVIAPGSFQHFLTRADQEAVLGNARNHLLPGGCFAFGVFFPKADTLEDVPDEKEWFSFLGPNGEEVRVSGFETYDHLTQIKTETAIRRWTALDGREMVHHAPLLQRLFFPQELEALLHYNGFAVVERYGDPEKAPLTNDSTVMYIVCRKM